MLLVRSNATRSHVIRQTAPRRRLPLCIRALSTTNPLYVPEQHILEQDSFLPRPEPNPRAQRIAILGGGITGLTAAYHIARTIPNAKITLYEASNRLGGWVDSESVKVSDGEVLFEWGPRTLRPDMGGPGTATLHLLVNLGLEDSIVGIAKDHPAAVNRFLYYPDHLVRMPGPQPGFWLSNIWDNLRSLWSESIFSGAFRALFREPSVTRRPLNLRDESVGSFLERRFGTAIADNLASALFHGIYAGDIYKLSMRTLLPKLWYLENRDPDGNGVITEMVDLNFKRQTLLAYQNVKFHNMVIKAADVDLKKLKNRNFIEMVAQTSVYTFHLGLQALTQRLVDVLRDNPNVIIRKNAAVQDVVFDSNQTRLQVSAKGDIKPLLADYVVSTLPPKMVQKFFNSSSRSRKEDPDVSLINTCSSIAKSVNVMVVNLYYASPELIPAEHRGFGYLIPRSVDIDQNPERALGVIFGSETSGHRGKNMMTHMKIPQLSPEDHDTRIQTYEKVVQQFEQYKKNTKASEASVKRFEEKVARVKAENDEIDQMYEFIKVDKPGAFPGTENGYYEMRRRDGFDRGPIRFGQDSASGTKLTVMMGGHWWDEWNTQDLPSEKQAIEMAKKVLKRHLNITEEPQVAKARLNKDAIPQHPPGYRDYMATIHKGLMKEYQGRFKVAGPWWQGAVGVNDSVKKAREAAFSIREAWDDKTGLEEYTKDEEWCLMDRRTGVVLMDPMNE